MYFRKLLLGLLIPLCACGPDWPFAYALTPHDERLDVPRGGTFPLAVTVAGDQVWVLSWHNIIRFHDQAPAVQMHRFDAHDGSATRIFLSEAPGAAGISPPSVLAAFTSGAPSPEAAGLLSGTYGSLPYFRAGADGFTSETSERPDHPPELYGIPSGTVLRQVPVSVTESWNWFSTMRVIDNETFLITGQALLDGKGNLVGENVGWVSCADGTCRILQRGEAQWYLFQGPPTNPFAESLQSAPATQLGRTWFRSACVLANGTPVVIEPDASYAITVSAPEIRKSSHAAPVRKLFDTIGDLLCQEASDTFLWAPDEGPVMRIDWPRGEVSATGLSMKRIPREGYYAHDRRTVHAVSLGDGWVVVYADVERTRVGNGCNKYEYCASSMNEFGGHVARLDADGKVVWRNEF